MYSLYYQPFSCSLAVHIALEKTGMPYELIRVDLLKGEQFSADYLALNPFAQVPVLAWQENKMSQAGAILIWLDERYPEAGLLPKVASGKRTLALQMLFYVSNTLHPLYSRLFYPDRVAASHTQEVKQTAKNLLHEHLSKLNNLLAGEQFLCGAQACAVDYYFLATCNWMMLFQIDVGVFPNIQQYLKRLKQIAEISLVLSKEKTAMAA